MILFNAYKYLYYRIYSSQLRWFGEDELPEIKAVIIVSLVNWLNISAILIAISKWTRFSELDPLNMNKINQAIIVLFICGFNFLIFVNKKYYKQLSEQFSNESVFKRRINLILIFAYIIFSLVIVLLF